jgi:hypothetical protein
MSPVDLEMLAEAVLAEWRHQDVAAQPVAGAPAVPADAGDGTW